MANNQLYLPYPWQLTEWERCLAQVRRDKSAHAYIIAGERGLGKSDFARALAGVFLCDGPKPTGACGQCKGCLLAIAGSHPDLLLVTPDEGKKVLRVEQIRSLVRFAQKTRHGSAHKVVILEHADSMNNNAANALLKTLEEPPEHTVLLLLSDNPGRLLPTLRSRCQRIVFHRPDPGIAMAWLGTVFDDGDKLSTALTLAGGKPLLARDYLENGEMESRQALLAAFSQLLNREIEPVAFVAASKQLDSTEMTAYLLQISTIVIQYLLANHRPANISPVLSSIMDSLEAGGTTMLLKEKARESTNKEAMKETEKKAEKSVKAAIEESDEGAAGKKRGGSDSVTRLIQFNRMAEEAHRQLKSVSNPNPQLILESLLWRWSRITVPARGKYN